MVDFKLLIINDDGDIVQYCGDDGKLIFSISKTSLDKFGQEFKRDSDGIRLCIEARMTGHWRGDILRPDSW